MENVLSALGVLMVGLIVAEVIYRWQARQDRNATMLLHAATLAVQHIGISARALPDERVSAADIDAAATELEENCPKNDVPAKFRRYFHQWDARELREKAWPELYKEMVGAMSLTPAARHTAHWVGAIQRAVVVGVNDKSLNEISAMPGDQHQYSGLYLKLHAAASSYLDENLTTSWRSEPTTEFLADSAASVAMLELTRPMCRAFIEKAS